MILSDYKLEYIFEVKKNADLCPDLDNFWTYMSRFFFVLPKVLKWGLSRNSCK